MRYLNSIIISKNVTAIDAYAFSNCKNITDVYYTGTEEEWKEISIGSNNTYLTKATIHYNYIGNYEYDVDSSIDEYIIGEVKKYTSSGDYAQFDTIMSSNASYEEKFRRLNELFANEGLTDVKEGIEYLSDSTAYRAAYNFLTTDEIYCAFNYYNWLYTTKSGLAARSALYSSGLIFNFEALSYLNLSTYTENDYPGVKKNKALLKEIMEIDNSNVVNDIFSYSNKTAKFFKNIIKLNGIVEDDEIDSLMDRILAAKTQGEVEILQKQFAQKIVKEINTNNPEASILNIDIFSENFGKALGSASNILSFAGATVDDIVSLAKLDSDIEIYKQYNKFLTTIYSNTDVSFEMRLAAYQLLDEINNGYYNRIVSILMNVVDLAKGFMYMDKSMLQTFLEEQGLSASGAGLFMDAIGTLSLATTISNLVINTGYFVKQVAYTQGYAELATLYCLKLQEDKQAFLADESAENAWNFFEDYTMLWKLRYNGEQQYLDMSSVKALIWATIKTYKYDEKEEIVKDNQERLNDFKFKIPSGLKVPTSVQYEMKSVVHCPVDVYVYNSSNELIATLKDGEESNLVNDYGRFAVVRESYSGEYSKVICQSTDEDLTIKMVAVDDGLVDYQSLSSSSNDVKTIDKFMVETGNNIDVIGDSYSVDTNADGNADINGSLITKNINSYIAVESISATENNITLISGQNKTMGITVQPENATNTSVEWISLDENVVTVQNGLIKAIGSGTTTVIARTCDSDGIECEITVEVLDKMEYEILSHKCNENSLDGKIKVKNNVDTKMVATMYVAIHGSDGIFKDVSLTPIELDANGETVKDVKIENYVYTKDDYIKVFIWSDLETLIPMCEYVEK